MNIVLIGYRGSGKSSIGHILAARLGREFVDTDVLIVQEAGCTIKEIFDREGEAGFRTRETTAIRAAAARDNLVIAVGGGAILRPENVVALKQNAKVVWLRARADILFQRIQADSATSQTRPNLTAAGGLEEVERLLAARMPFYEGAADFELDVEQQTIDTAAQRVLDQVAPFIRP